MINGFFSRNLVGQGEVEWTIQIAEREKTPNQEYYAAKLSYRSEEDFTGTQSWENSLPLTLPYKESKESFKLKWVKEQRGHL